jgi:4-hydroxy-2-oxoheptanedioate aldolase
MTGADLGQALRAGHKVFGTLLVSNSPFWPSAVLGTGVDFVFLDTEHVPLDRHDLAWMCRAYGALGLPPLVRISSPDPYQATQVLDGGAAGVVAPYVETVEQMQALRGAIKCRPIKGQSLAGHLSGEAPFGGELANYVNARNAGNVFVVNIESRPAIENLDRLLAVEGLDAVLIGPHDLSCNLGIPEQYDHPVFEEACRTIFTKARAAGIGAGCHVYYGNVQQQIRWMGEAGANLIIHSDDIHAFAQKMTEDIRALRTAAGSPMPARGKTMAI